MKELDNKMDKQNQELRNHWKNSDNRITGSMITIFKVTNTDQQNF